MTTDTMTGNHPRRRDRRRIRGHAGGQPLRMRDDVITLVNPRPQFVERIQAASARRRHPRRPADYGALLGEGIQLVVDSSPSIDTATDKQFAGPQGAACRTSIIYAVGSTAAAPASARSHRIRPSLGELEYAEWLRDSLAEVHPDAPVTVVGAGLTGTEMASSSLSRAAR